MTHQASNQQKQPGDPLSLRRRLPNGFQLTPRQWLCAGIMVVLFVQMLPRIWKHWEWFKPTAHYRVPYEASQDYWMYERHLKHRLPENAVFFVGDSVVWGEYVSPEATWSAWLNQHSEGKPLFVNLALNGLYPLALDGLIRHYGSSLKSRQVILHCNLLWMSSPEADLSLDKEQVFNHPTLIPQFRPRIPSYRASMDTRLGRVIGNRASFLAWVRHLQIQYWDRKDPYAWTLADDGQYPPAYPNARRMPWSEIDFKLLREPSPDPERGTTSRRHQPWSEDGIGTQRFDWVPLDQSLQWQAFQRLCEVLVSNRNSLLVVLGPFNKHIMAEDNRERFESMEASVRAWFHSESIPFVAPEVLDSRLYGDASHPLTEGYRQLASDLWQDPVFQTWLLGE